MASEFGTRLRDAFDKNGQLCIGIDPHEALIRAWGLQDSAAGLREFCLRSLDACYGQVSLIKPQVSFFERFGAAGFEVLSEITQMAREAQLLVIADAKRGDIGTTMSAYLEAWFGEKSGLYADALTVSPYLGLETVTNGFERWKLQGKGLFSLVATSNSEGYTVQTARVGDNTLASEQWAKLENRNSDSSDLGCFGAVIGATLDLDDFRLSRFNLKTPILAPGFGAQGAKLSEAREIYGELSSSVIFSVSRSILGAGQEGMRSAIAAANVELLSGLG